MISVAMHIIVETTHVIGKTTHVIDAVAHAISETTHVIGRTNHVTDGTTHVIGETTHVINDSTHVIDEIIHVIVNISHVMDQMTHVIVTINTTNIAINLEIRETGTLPVTLSMTLASDVTISATDVTSRVFVTTARAARGATTRSRASRTSASVSSAAAEAAAAATGAPMTTRGRWSVATSGWQHRRNATGKQPAILSMRLRSLTLITACTRIASGSRSEAGASGAGAGAAAAAAAALEQQLHAVTPRTSGMTTEVRRRVVTNALMMIERSVMTAHVIRTSDLRATPGKSSSDVAIRRAVIVARGRSRIRLTIQLLTAAPAQLVAAVVVCYTCRRKPPMTRRCAHTHEPTWRQRVICHPIHRRMKVTRIRL